MGDGGAEGSSTVGHGGQAAISLMLDLIHILESLQCEGSRCRGLIIHYPALNQPEEHLWFNKNIIFDLLSYLAQNSRNIRQSPERCELSLYANEMTPGLCVEEA